MRSVRYQILDEPKPSGLARFAVDPIWPLLAVMLAGNGLGVLWFVFNSYALGSPHRLRDWGLLILDVLLLFGLLIAIYFAVNSFWISIEQGQYIGAVVFPMLRIGIGYMFYLSQANSAELLQYFGKPLSNGLLGLIGVYLLRYWLIKQPEVPDFLMLFLR
jgi:hypothetical protein